MYIQRCRSEIAAIEALIRAGHPEVEGLCLALSDWCAELRLIEQEMALEERTPAGAEAGRAEGQGSECYFPIE
jgi:hypothetical protein